MNTKIFGGILLIVGMAIGAGMLALPVVTAEGGFWGATFLLVACWMAMTFSSFLVLEVNLWFPLNSNIILMAKRTLGYGGQLVAWICYLSLFYCLLAAYISSGSDVLHELLLALGIAIPVHWNALLFVFILGIIVYKGISVIDYANRGLMLIKMGTLFLLVVFAMPYVNVNQYQTGHVKYLLPALTVVMTSFGFANIIPSLRCYFNNDIKKLRLVILLGSLIPLVCYFFWIAVVLGSVPYQGKHGLQDVVQSDHSTLALIQSLVYYLNNDWIISLTRIFTSVCVATSFLGVALSVVDFLADGFSLEKIGMKNVFLHLATFFPPLFIALFYPKAFILGLNYAGIFISILLVILPALMVWVGRYHKKIESDYRVFGGKISLVIISLVGLLVILQGLFWRS